MPMEFIMPRQKRRKDPKAKLYCEDVQRNLMAVKELEGINPKFAKHVFLRNDLMRYLTLDNYGTIQVM